MECVTYTNYYELIIILSSILKSVFRKICLNKQIVADKGKFDFPHKISKHYIDEIITTEELISNFNNFDHGKPLQSKNCRCLSQYTTYQKEKKILANIKINN